MDRKFSPLDLVCFIIIWPTIFSKNISIRSGKTLKYNFSRYNCNGCPLTLIVKNSKTQPILIFLSAISLTIYDSSTMQKKISHCLRES